MPQHPAINIPFVSLHAVNGSLRAELLAKTEEMLNASDYILGKEVVDFEQNYAVFCNSKYGIGVNSGFDALKVALLAAGVKPGDEVIVPAHTFIATWMAVSDIGAIPIGVDADALSYNINATAIEAAISPRTKGIIPVHLYGQPADMDAVMEVADKYKLHVIEDNAQAQGATYKGKLTGSIGHINATSFYPAKNLGALGDAGAITTNVAELYEKANAIRNYGSKQKYIHDELGVNTRLDTLQAAYLNIKLKHLQTWNDERIKIADLYNRGLAHLSNKGLILPQVAEGCAHVYHLYVVRCTNRDGLKDYLAQHNIQTLIHYPVPAHLQQAYAFRNYKKGDFAVAEELAETVLSLPMYPGLSESEVAYVCDKVQSFFKQ